MTEIDPYEHGDNFSQGVGRLIPETVDLNEPLRFEQERIEQQERLEHDQRRDDFGDLYDG